MKDEPTKVSNHIWLSTGIRFLNVISLGIFLLFCIIEMISGKAAWNLLYSFGRSLITNGSAEVTISTVLIGIYLTLYTTLASNPQNSVFSKIMNSTFISLSRITISGIVFNLIFVIASMFFSLIIFNKVIVFILVVLYLLILTNFVQVSMCYVLAFHQDAKNRDRNLALQKDSDERIRFIYEWIQTESKKEKTEQNEKNLERVCAIIKDREEQSAK